jgi:predicted MFS family arabinose efflux permease
MSLNLPLTALAAGAFAIGMTEFAPMGMLPVIAADLHVDRLARLGGCVIRLHLGYWCVAISGAAMAAGALVLVLAAKSDVRPSRCFR